MQAQKVLSELQHKIAVYQSMRGMRVPVVMEKHVGQRAPPIPETDNKTAASQHPPPSTSREPLGPPQRIPEVPPSIGKAQVPEVAFGGVANQEVLWALPKHQSPEASSDSSSVVEKPKMPPVSGAGNDLMTEIDWVSGPSIYLSILFCVPAGGARKDAKFLCRMLSTLCSHRINKMTS
jgi:hypothetical protein